MIQTSRIYRSSELAFWKMSATCVLNPIVASVCSPEIKQAQNTLAVARLVGFVPNPYFAAFAAISSRVSASIGLFL